MEIRRCTPRFPRTPAVSLLLAGTLVCGGAGCGGTEPPAPARITVSPPIALLQSFDEMVRLTAAVYDQDGRLMTDVTPDWASTDASVAGVNDAGLVTAHGNGTANITASAGTAEAISEVTVEQEAAEVTVSPPAHTVAALGDTARLSAEARDANGNEVAGAAFSWVSNDMTVALVDTAGLVRGVGEGRATITATSGRSQGSSEVTVENPERAVLTALYEATDGPNWLESGNWLTDAPPRDWWGVRADDLGRVTFLTLSANRLRGPVPPELGSLPRLTSLDLRENSLTGPIPAELGNLSLLTWLDLGDNGLTGPIPPELGDPAGLRWLALERNDLTGSIPPELLDLSDLTRLVLSRNNLTGGVPAELGDLSALTWLDLGDNGLTGPIPDELGDLSALTWLDLGGNGLTGGIPDELGDLSDLTWLDLGGNSLTGPIPDELGDLSALTWLDLGGNGLTGGIPDELGDLADLVRLDLGSNHLTGSIPPELGDLSDATTLDLVNNDLTGSIPPELGAMSSLVHMTLSGNPGLSGSLPAGLTSLTRLETLLATGTGLCAPTDPDFLTWLERVHRRRIARCADALPLAYLTQPAQSRRFPVPLVADEAALLRVFVIARKATTVGIPLVRARFYVGDRETHAQDIPGKPDPIPTEVDESDLSKSANARIPGDVVEPGLEFVIEVDPNEELDSALGVPGRIPATGRLPVEVWTMPVFDLTLIPFLWSQDPDSSVVDDVEDMEADPGGHGLLWETRTLLPIRDLEVTAHQPVENSSNNASVLLRETAAIRAMEGGTGHYLGMMSGPVAGAPGAAYLRGRSSFSVPAGAAIAHELGHNLNLYHAPCGSSGGIDPSFPSADGSIGAWGYDFRDGGALVDPSAPDLMSYCSPRWIGDYHFSNALRFRRSETPAPRHRAGARAILLWGGTGADGTPLLEPAFVVEAPPALPDSAGDHSITGRTPDGAELFSFSFTMPETAGGDGSSSFAYVLPVEPGWERRLASIALTGPGGSAVLDRDSDLRMAILRNPQTGRIRGILRGGDATRAMLADADGNVPPGLQLLFSRGIPDEAAWSR